MAAAGGGGGLAYLSFRLVMNSSMDTLSKSTKSAFPNSRLSCSAMLLPFLSLELAGEIFLPTCFEVPAEGEHWRASLSASSPQWTAVRSMRIFIRAVKVKL